jgi:hypothetical protein
MDHYLRRLGRSKTLQRACHRRKYDRRPHYQLAHRHIPLKV